MGLISSERPVVLVGAGKMGGAMLTGWLKDGRAGQDFVILDPMLADEMKGLVANDGVRHFEAMPDDLVPSIVIIAVKPQMMDAVLPKVAASKNLDDTAFVSVAAGTSVATFQSHFGAEAAIVRAMPNTPSQVGRGITIGYPTAGVSADQKAAIAELLEITGGFDWVDREALIDAVTAVSGSGPAYVFHMVEAMAASGEKAGLSPELALRLARATVEGAGELLYQSDLDAGTLRKNVTSPGGTTAAALDVLMDENGLTSLMTKAVDAAKARAEELGRA
ncbi:MAG: pyrroline-5-carboxylate reductase [Hyphomicrobiales bacterium]